MKYVLAVCLLFSVVLARSPRAPGNDCLTPQCGGFIGSVFSFGNPLNCSYVNVNLESSDVHALASLNCCKDLKNSNPATPVTAYDNSHKSLLYISGNGNYLWGVNVQTGAEKQIATLPSGTYTPIAMTTLLTADYSAYNLFLSTNIGLYAIMSVPMKQRASAKKANALATFTQVGDLSSLKLDGNSYVAGFNNTLYILDKGSLFAVNVANAPAVITKLTLDPATCGPVITSGITLQYWIRMSGLVTMVQTNVYTINLQNGKCATLFSMPAGVKLPVTSSALFSDMYFVVDSQPMLYELNLNAKSNEGNVPLKTEGFPDGGVQYYY